MSKLINVPAEIRMYWWENSENLINVPGTTISDSRALTITNNMDFLWINHTSI